MTTKNKNYVEITEQAFALYVNLEKLFLLSLTDDAARRTERLEQLTAAARKRMLRRKRLVLKFCSAADFNYVSSLWHKYGESNFS